MARRRLPKNAGPAVLKGQAEPVPMRIACSLVYHQLNRDVGNIPMDSGYEVALNSTALALSQVSDIYHVEQGRLLRVPSEELIGGSFGESGAVFRAASGKVYRSLSMRRIDVMQAMVILRNARAAIDAARDAAKAGNES